MNFLNEIRSFSENFRSILYLVANVSIGYIILVNFLSIMDAGSVGLSWLANNPNNAFVIIFVLWLFLILAIDLIIDLISNYSKRMPKTISIPKVQKTLGKFYQRARSEEKPFSGEGLANLISGIKEARVSGPKKTKWSHFWGKEDKTNITSRSLEDKQIKRRGRKTSTIKKEAPEAQAGTSEDQQTVKREVTPLKGEPKTKAPQKEASGKPETKLFTPAKKIIGNTAKGITAGTKIFEEPEQIREPADNIQSTDTVAISVKKGSRFREAFDDEHYVSVIDFTPNISRKKTMIRVEKLKATSHLVGEIPPNIIFDNFNIWVNIPEKDIDKPGIVFRVDKSWITENNLREIQLYKYMDHEWVLQGPTEKLDEDGGYFYFQTPLKGLSGSYAIVGI